MPVIKFTQKDIDRLPAPDPSGKQTLYWEINGNGFAVLVSGVSSAKTFIVERKLPGQKTRRVTVGPTNKLKLADTTGVGPDGKKINILGARSRAAPHIADMIAGNDPKAARREAARRGKTLRQALDDYLKGKKKLAEKSRKGYRAGIERHLKSWLDRPLRDITRETVEKRHEAIAAATAKPGRSGGGANTGQSTADGVMRALRAIYNYAFDNDSNLPPNPVRLRDKWYDVPSRERHLTGDQLPIFYRAVDALPNRTQRDYLLFLLFTGLRRTSAAALCWDQVDFSSGVIRLPRKQMKGGKRGLDLPLTNFLRDLLVARRALGNDRGWVFGADSRSGHLEEPKSAFEQIAQACAIELSAHDLRRTYLTHAEETDISVMALKALVNHSIGGKDVTESYIQMTVARLREPAQRVCDRLKMLCGIEEPQGVTRIGA